MSDGDSATPGQHRASDPQANDRPTRTPRPAGGATPWERASATSHRIPEQSRPAPEPSGNHTEGVTVADLIAKIAGTKALDQPARHNPQPRPQPHDHLEARPEAHDNALDITEPIQVVAAYADEIPNLEALAHSRLPLAADPEPGGWIAPEPVEDAKTPGGAKPRTATKSRKATKPAKPKRRRPVLLAGRSAAALFAVSALLLTGGAWQWQSAKNNLLRNVAALDPHSRDILDPNAQFGDENFLIVGVDSRAGANGDIGAGTTADAGGARSDTVMLVNIPASRERVVAVSFPRDLAITPMKCQAWDPDTGEYGPVYDKETGEYGPDQVYTETKLNSAYSFGGPKCLVKVIQKMSGLSINRFMAIDFVGFAKMVDALGGVDVCSTTPLKDYELGTVLAKAGHQILDGQTALNYVRARQVTTEVNGDYGRIKRQQLFLSSLLRSIISKDVLFSLRKLNHVVNMFIADTYVDNVKTKDLVDLGQSLQGVNAGRITFVTVPTTGITDADGNEPPRTSDIRALFDAIINDDPLPGENDTNATTSPATAAMQTLEAAAPSDDTAESAQTEVVNAVTTDPQNVTVRVSNSTSQDGLANAAAAELHQHGFNLLTPNDYPGTMPSTTVRFSPGNEQAAATVAAAFAGPPIERVTGLGGVVQVVLGPDFRAVTAPPPSGSAVEVRISHDTHSTPTELPEDLTVTNGADTTCE